MFKTIDELKLFILWAKAQKIVRIKVDKIEVELSALAFIDSLGQEAPESQTPDSPGDEQSLSAQEKEDEELQFWSSRP